VRLASWSATPLTARVRCSPSPPPPGARSSPGSGPSQAPPAPAARGVRSCPATAARREADPLGQVSPGATMRAESRDGEIDGERGLEQRLRERQEEPDPETCGNTGRPGRGSGLSPGEPAGNPGTGRTPGRRCPRWRGWPAWPPPGGARAGPPCSWEPRSHCAGAPGCRCYPLSESTSTGRPARRLTRWARSPSTSWPSRGGR
jgi:hypothetical protein